MKIVTVCGFGIGSSLILKMSVDKVLLELNMTNIVVESADRITAPTVFADLYLTSNLIAKELEQQVNSPVISIQSFIDKIEIKDKIQHMVRY